MEFTNQGQREDPKSVQGEKKTRMKNLLLEPLTAAPETKRQKCSS